MTSSPVGQLTLAKADFLPFLKGLARLGGRTSKDEVVIGFDGEELWVRAGGMESSVPALGNWPGEAVIAHATLKAIAKIPTADDPVTLVVDGTRLRIGGLAVPCRWNAAHAAVASIPMNADLRELLLADLMHHEAALEASGLLKRVQEARGQRDKLLDQACALLVPLGVSREGLARLVHERLLERL